MPKNNCMYVLYCSYSILNAHLHTSFLCKLLESLYRIRQNFRGEKLSWLCTKHTIHWKTFAVHQAHAIMYCTQQIIQGENFRDWLKTAKVLPHTVFLPHVTNYRPRILYEATKLSLTDRVWKLPSYALRCVCVMMMNLSGAS